MFYVILFYFINELKHFCDDLEDMLGFFVPFLIKHQHKKVESIDLNSVNKPNPQCN